VNTFFGQIGFENAQVAGRVGDQQVQPFTEGLHMRGGWMGAQALDGLALRPG